MLTFAVFVVLLAVSPATTTAASTEACGHTCSGTAAITKAGEREQHCLPDAGCGGGALLAAGTGPFLALATATGIIGLAVAATRRFAFRRVLPSGLLLATRLFHPPQISLSV